MNNYDVLIVGGGPSGSTAAKRLTDAGASVAIIDKKDFPRDKVCAGWVTPAVLEVLNFDAEEYARDHVFQPIRSFETSQIGGPSVHTSYGDDVVSYGIRRVQFDNYLVRRCGATLLTGRPVKSIDYADKQWTINGEFSAPMLIGAGGHFCPIARHLGAKVGSTETIVAANEIEFQMTPEQVERCAVAEDTPELFFCEDLQGYGWVFRKNDVLNIGLGREDNRNIAEHVDRFREYLAARGRIPEDIPTKFKGHAYILHNRSKRRCFDDGVMLAGDSIGLAYTQSGEGIRPAVESALMVADRILRADGDFSAAKFADFESDMTARFGARGTDEGSAGWVPEGLRRAIAGRLLATKWFSRHVVLDRWFLHAATPPLKIA
ncbi:MAG: FAD-dependent monooxygenase [Pseudomonadota bacterium]